MMAMTPQTKPGCSSLHAKLDIRECVCPASDRLCGAYSSASRGHLAWSSIVAAIFAMLNPLALAQFLH